MTIEQILYCTVYIIVRTGPKVELAHKSRALLYSDLVRQTNRHASNKPSCVKRTVMRQPSEYEINSTVSLFLLFGPSCVNRHASKYELAFNSLCANTRTFTRSVGAKYCTYGYRHWR